MMSGHGTEKSGNNTTRYRNQNPSTARQQTNRNLEKFQGKQRHGNYRQGQGSSVNDKQIDLPHVSETVTFIETNMPIVKGCIGDRIINVLRDTSCSRAVIRRDLVVLDQMTGQNQKYILANGNVVEVDLAEVEIDTPYYIGTVIAWCFDNPSYDLILGNFNGVRNPDDPDTSWIRSTGTTAAVQTRAQAKKRSPTYKPLRVPDAVSEVTPKEIAQEQKTDQTLEKLRTLAKDNSEKSYKDGGKTKIYERNNIMYRDFTSPKCSNGKVFQQLIVPKKYRNAVMKLAHETIMAGHLGIKKTTDRLISEFYWPGVDLVGPLEPRITKGNKYILTLVDYATRYLEAVPLPGLETERVAEALVDIFSRVGIPREMLSDQGSQFTSDLLKEVSRLLSLKRITTSPYHPICNGLVEKFNGTLKQMLKRMCAEKPKDWDKYINALLFAY